MPDSLFSNTEIHTLLIFQVPDIPTVEGRRVMEMMGETAIMEGLNKSLPVMEIMVEMAIMEGLNKGLPFLAIISEH
jgi:hypothetical protein